MKATILSNQPAPPDSLAEIHRFEFVLDDGTGTLVNERISLRTARVIVENLPDGNAFIKMLRSIVATETTGYDQLNNSVYLDDHAPGGDGVDGTWPRRWTGSDRSKTLT
ncbi:hypothetical protein [Caballeronia sp. GAFFF1]|uniref:hypothetical protein n=1 Tax=Caballeronia sp. GAFFF1 TaxID=2921779 RepID=UPI0020280D17|nr:hypothetical protein [Caballeronia sp. GAFFF1]